MTLMLGLITLLQGAREAVYCKTVAAKLLLAKTILLSNEQPIQLVISDAKSGMDFEQFKNFPNVHRGEDAPNAIYEAYKTFRKRQKEAENGAKYFNRLIVFIDEVASLFSMVTNKTEKERIMREFAMLAQLSRAYKISIVQATQQPSAQMYGSAGTGVREQFSPLLIGAAGNETQGMLFDADSREAIKAFGSIGGRSVGFFSLNGGLAKPVRVPRVNDFNKLHAAIRRGLENSLSKDG